MYGVVAAAKVISQFMNLGMTIMAAGDAIGGPGLLNLAIFDLAVEESLLFVTGLKKAPAPATTEVIGFIGSHIDKVLLSHTRLDHKAHVIGSRVSKAFPNDLTRVLKGELNAKLIVPAGIGFQLSFTNPRGVKGVHGLYVKFMGNFKLVQSYQDCKGDVPSLGV